MKSLIIFYSYEGNCRMVADWIQAITESDIVELEPEDNQRRSGLSKFLWGGKQVFTGAQPKLRNEGIALEDYDLIFLGTPVWAGSFAPALNTFFADYKLQGKKIALFCCSGGGKGKIFEKMKSHLDGNEIIGELELVTPAWKNTEKMHEKLMNWIDALSNI